MKKFNKTTKVAMAMGAGAIAIASTGAAYAFIGVGASGGTTGSAGVTTTNPFSDVTLTGAGTMSALVPGGTASTVLVTVSNPNSFSVGYPQFHVVVGYGSPANGSCTAAQADISGSSATVSSGTLASKDHFTVSVPVSMGDAGTGTDQSSCISSPTAQSIPLTYTIVAGPAS